ncbi:MAG TPA: manganese transporter [Verrucomicrobiales bacterium]|nr:manganese transporter [Verrucomicrobiales bacterium]HCI91027.1 manganese transporter [Verrucomicrobiales bacterium]
MNYKTMVAIVSVVLAFLGVACHKKEDNYGLGNGPRSYPFNTAATVGMIADIVRNVAGDKAVVHGIIGEGVDPHVYKPSRPDVVVLSESDIVFYNGLMLEGKMGDVLIRVARKGKLVHAVTEEILDGGDYVMTDAEEHYDPHVWMDVQGWIKATDVVAKALAEYDSENAEYYKANGAKYKKELVKLDAYAKRVVSSIPEKQRVLVTAHDAFNYMGRAYGLKVMGIQGMSTESEAGVKRIEDLVSYLSENSIPAVFVESSVSDKNVKALVEGSKAKGHSIRIGGELFSDAMGASGTYEGTYIGMIDHNVTVLTRALGGEAPKKGLNGKLSH